MTAALDKILDDVRRAGQKDLRRKAQLYNDPAGRGRQDLLLWLETARFSPAVNRAAKWMRAEPDSAAASTEVLAELRRGLRKWRKDPWVMGFTDNAIDNHEAAIAIVRKVRGHQQQHAARQRRAESGYAGLFATINQAAE